MDSDGTVGTADTTTSNLIVGGNLSPLDDNTAYRGFLSFDLSSLPAALQSTNVLSANLRIFQLEVFGNPYTDLAVGSSGLILDHVDYGSSLTFTDFDPTVFSTLGDISSTFATGSKNRAVVSALKADLSANRTRSQYRLRFAKLTNGNGKRDSVLLETGDSTDDSRKPLLQITYLIP